uniref:Uncharacterized protein n=1 Tax=Arundo donax TaxID=35708 RepID=A0A0A9BTX7_ARUDO
MGTALWSKGMRLAPPFGYFLYFFSWFRV